MPAIGIQNLDKWKKRVEDMQKACREEVQCEALAAAGDVLADALASATPVGKRSHKAKGGDRYPGNARNSIINVNAKSKKYGVFRRLIGYSKRAFYMLWVESGHDSVRGGKKARKGKWAPGAGGAHSQAGQGRVVGHVQAREFMHRVFQANIGRAKDAYIDSLKRQISKG